MRPIGSANPGDWPARVRIRDRRVRRRFGPVRSNRLRGLLESSRERLPQSLAAVGCPSRWEAGFLDIDNGASERSLNPVAIGRKNWLLAGTMAGGKTAAILNESVHHMQGPECRPAGPSDQRAGGRVSTHPAHRIEELLPDRWQAMHATAAMVNDDRASRADPPDGGTLPVEVDRRCLGNGLSGGA